MRVLDIKKYDVLNGPGTRLSIWLAGCCNKCPGCWAKQTWNPNQGVPLSEQLDNIKKDVADPYIKGVSLLGGDPLYNIMDENRRVEHWKEFINLLKVCSTKPIWLWTGYTYKEIEQALSEEQFEEMFQYIDYIVVGRFDITKRNLILHWRGSSNQRIIKVHHTSLGATPEDVTDEADSGKLGWE